MRIALIFVLALAGVGCARPETAADRQLARLRDGIDSLQAGQAELGQLASAEEADRRTMAEVNPMPKRESAAPPRTTRIGAPLDDSEDDPSGEAGARPEIRIHGTLGTVNTSRARGARGKGEIRIEPSEGDEGPRSSVIDPNAKKAYEQALALVMAKDYDKGQEALAAFVVRWPDHPYVENAYYWRGEAFFARGDAARAAEQFEAAIARGGNKTPDSLLKLGMCQERLGAPERAKEAWDRLRRNYARSDAAKKIPSSSSGTGAKENR